jgi:hypothetical protein
MKMENKVLAQKTYAEAERYLNNAYKELKLSDRNGKVFQDVKHMRIACGAAYLAALKAIDGILLMRNVPKPKRRPSIEYYQKELSQIDKKILTSLNIVYHILHIDGYYDGFNHIKTIESGFEETENIIHKLGEIAK